MRAGRLSSVALISFRRAAFHAPWYARHTKSTCRPRTLLSAAPSSP